jgi:hypothetical protein
MKRSEEVEKMYDDMDQDSDEDIDNEDTLINSLQA